MRCNWKKCMPITKSVFWFIFSFSSWNVIGKAGAPTVLIAIFNHDVPCQWYLHAAEWHNRKTLSSKHRGTSYHNSRTKLYSEFLNVKDNIYLYFLLLELFAFFFFRMNLSLTKIPTLSITFWNSMIIRFSGIFLQHIKQWSVSWGCICCLFVWNPGTDFQHYFEEDGEGVQTPLPYVFQLPQNSAVTLHNSSAQWSNI